MIRARAEEQAVLFLSVLKWFLLATAVGLLVGLPTALFLKLLGWGWRAARDIPFYFLALPLALPLSLLIVRRFAPEAEGHGTDKVIEAVHRRSGRIPLAVLPVKLLATLITITAGGSVGKEGPCAQIGAALASAFADLLRLSDRDRKKIVVCGISAGFAAVFGTPIAGALFGLEVLQVGSILYDVLLPSLVAGVTAYQVASALGVHYFQNPLAFAPEFNESFYVTVAAAGVYFGLCSLLLVEGLRLGRRIATRIHLSPVKKAFLGGCALALLALIFGRPYLGTGTGPIEAALKGVALPWYAFPVKIVFTSLTLSFGGSGGIVTPIFFVGSAAGALFAQVFHLDIATFAGLGLVGVLAGAANTPIAAILMALELFGSEFAAYAALCCAVSFLISGHHSVYPAQILGMTKSASLRVDTGGEIESALTTLAEERKGHGITGYVLDTLFRKAFATRDIPAARGETREAGRGDDEDPPE